MHLEHRSVRIFHIRVTCFFLGRGHRIRAVTGPCQNRSPHRKRPALEALILCSAFALCLTFLPTAATVAVGVSLIDFDSFGVQAGQRAAQVLDGTIGTGSPIKIRTTGIPTFAWRALKRWGSSESRLPPGSTVQFGEPTFRLGQILPLESHRIAKLPINTQLRAYGNVVKPQFGTAWQLRFQI